MRVERWNPNVADQEFENVSIERLVKAAEILKENAARKCPVGTVSRPIYKTGPYAGQAWTARDAGQLKRSVRVVQKHSKSGKPLMRKRNVRVYCGTFLAYYAAIVEHSKPYMRPALTQSLAAMRSAIGAK
ncbi:MAG: hypothetical protein M0R06_01615 [Sphaerochaeta sp.]|nr:hypothetical protein [Sphaerochaeta sp.]